MDLSDIPIPFGKCQDRLICDCRSILISVLISVLPELLEEIVNQVADEDLLPKAILGFPLIRDELIEFGGPEGSWTTFWSVEETILSPFPHLYHMFLSSVPLPKE